MIGAQVPRDSWCIALSDRRPEVAFYKDEKARYTRLSDGVYCDF